MYARAAYRVRGHVVLNCDILAFSIGVKVGHQMVVLPLFAALKLARESRPDTISRQRLSWKFQRLGSTGITMAGIYYLCCALMAI